MTKAVVIIATSYLFSTIDDVPMYCYDAVLFYLIVFCIFLVSNSSSICVFETLLIVLERLLMYVVIFQTHKEKLEIKNTVNRI